MKKYKTVLCHGVFDVLHAGHLEYFKAAKKFGKVLYVSVTSDRYVNKGPGRPYFTLQQRCEMLKALNVVDYVLESDYPTALEMIEKVRPDFYCKGPDYKDLTKDITGEILNEKRAVESFGGQLVFTDQPTHSSSKLINKFFHNWSDAQKNQIEKIQGAGGIRAVTNAIEEIAKLKVLVVGEPILDVYRFVSPEGISSKSPTVSCRFQYEEVYEGGSTAIARHLGSFCEADLVCGDRFPKKIRYIAGTQRVFEVTEIDDSYRPWDLRADDYDVVVAADFGHGMFKGGELNGVKAFVGLNVQSNSSNFGFNTFDKHKRFEYLCLDTREIRLAERDRHSDPLSIANRVRARVDGKLGFTCGANGAYLLSREEYFSPAFTDTVIDATGAGDAYFAITTCLIASGCNEELIPFIGNVFAGLKTKIIGNKSAVSKASLLKACSAILA